MISTKIKDGSAHGRFQPLHKGHLEYLLASKERCEFLWIGITQYVTKKLIDSTLTDHRYRPEDNPLTFFERTHIITESLLEIGWKRTDFGVIPFPIETPDLLKDFLPTSIPIFTTIYEEWNEKKIVTLEQQGYEVIVLWKRSEKEIEGADVRDKIRHSDRAWKNLVPPATIKAVEQYNLSDRMLELSQKKR